MDDNDFHESFAWLPGQYLDTAPIHLILDLYSVHRCEASRACAIELGIVLHFIPAGWTDELQLLDRYVFGVLKSICRKLFACHCTVAENTAVRKQRQKHDELKAGLFSSGGGPLQLRRSLARCKKATEP
jgi:hypothetical protein